MLCLYAFLKAPGTVWASKSNNLCETQGIHVAEPDKGSAFSKAPGTLLASKSNHLFGHRIESGPDSGVGTPDCLFSPTVWKFPPTLRGSLENITHICRVWKKGVPVFPTRLRFPTARLLGTVGMPDCRMPDCFPDSILRPGSQILQ